MYRKTRFAAWAALLVFALTATVARADWNVGDKHKMHFPQLPDPTGFDVNFTFPGSVADDWRCSETGPVQDIHFWFSAQGDWLNLQNPLPAQIQNIAVAIYEDVPAGPVIPYSRPGRLLWSRSFPINAATPVKIRQTGAGPQWWYNPFTGQVIPNDHQKIYQCNIPNITDGFWQKKGTIYWLEVSIQAQGPLGWKSANLATYPPPFTNNHFQDDGAWRPDPAAGWQDIHYPAGPLQGQSMDLAFVITGEKPLFNYKMHFPQYPDPTGADLAFSFPRVAADDWRCSCSGPIADVHFWFSAINDWFDITQPLNLQIFNIHLSIHADIPAIPGGPGSHPGALLWQRDINVLDPAVHITRFTTEGQAWFDPQQGYVPNNHRFMYECDIFPIPAPFQQECSKIYWLDVSITSEAPLGWKTADVDGYPGANAGVHFQDDCVWAPDITLPAIPWLEMHWPPQAPKAGQSFDLAFVVTGGPGITGVNGSGHGYQLEQNYPNPFNPTTTIRFTLPEEEDVQLAVFSVDGKLIRVLASGVQPAGASEATWNGLDQAGRPAASGVYFYRLKTGSFTQTKKMVLMK
jgi:FlgD Ig-like domain